MRIQKISALCAGLLAVLSIASCDGVLGDYKSFDSELVGTWESQLGIYSGSLEITYDTITIEGYEDWQTPSPVDGGDDSERPFREFPKGVPLSGYSEEGKIFIEEAGKSYTYRSGKTVLEFEFGDKKHWLDKVLE